MACGAPKACGPPSVIEVNAYDISGGDHRIGMQFRVTNELRTIRYSLCILWRRHRLLPLLHVSFFQHDQGLIGVPVELKANQNK